jgi:hypothetical protein
VIGGLSAFGDPEVDVSLSHASLDLRDPHLYHSLSRLPHQRRPAVPRPASPRPRRTGRGLRRIGRRAQP